MTFVAAAISAAVLALPLAAETLGRETAGLGEGHNPWLRRRGAVSP